MKKAIFPLCLLLVLCFLPTLSLCETAGLKKAIKAPEPVFIAEGKGPDTISLSLPEGRYYAVAQTPYGDPFWAQIAGGDLFIFNMDGGIERGLLRDGQLHRYDDVPLEILDGGSWRIEIFEITDFASTKMAQTTDPNVVACYEGQGDTILYGVNLDPLVYSIEVETDNPSGIWITGPYAVSVLIPESGEYVARFTGYVLDDVVKTFSDDVLFVNCNGDNGTWRISIFEEAEDPPYLFKIDINDLFGE